jgi:predicted DNA-binding WGR domain protein
MQIMEEWAGHYYDQAENADKIWAAAFTDSGAYLAVWGRRDNRKYQSQTKSFNTVTTARAQFEQMVHQKERKGYHKVPFADARFGNIPSFMGNLSGNISSPSSSAKISGANLLARCRQLLQRLKKKFEPDTMLVEFQQLRATTAVLLEYREQIRANQDEDTDFVPAELETTLNTLASSIKQALLT